MKAQFAVLGAILLAGCSSRPAPAPAPASQAAGTIVRLDPALDALAPPNAQIEKVAGGFEFTEGPMWRPDGHLWFSDVTANVVRSMTASGQAEVLIPNGGGDAHEPPGAFVGPNAMVPDKDGTVILCQHYNRRLVKIGPGLKITPYVEKFEGKRLNSPNDLVFRGDGALYFTDPPYGLAKMDDDPAKELKFNGVFRYANGKLEAVIKDLTRPNGIAFSPDQNTLYVANSDDNHKVWMRYDINAAGVISKPRVFADVTAVREEGTTDGMKTDSLGNLYAAGPGGVWVFTPDGKHLGTFKLPEPPSNCAWGDDGKSLYITARTSVYRIKLAVAGQRPVYYSASM